MDRVDKYKIFCLLLWIFAILINVPGMLRHNVYSFSSVGFVLGVMIMGIMSWREGKR